MYINGKRIQKNKMIEVISPYSGEIAGKIACADDEDVEIIIKYAENGSKIMKQSQ